MPRLLVLYESAAGLSLFDCKGVNIDAITEKSVQSSLISFPLFSQMCKLIAFAPFLSPESALDTITLMTEGQPSDFIRDFFSTNVISQVSKHKSGVVIGVSEPKLAGAIHEEFNIECQSDNVIREILRAIRLHFDKYMDQINLEDIRMAQLSLSHSYSRAKVKFNQHGDDNMIIAASDNLQTLDKDLISFSKRLREWYHVHFPELSSLVENEGKYAECVSSIGDRHTINKDALMSILNDADLVDRIIYAAEHSTGRDLEEVDSVRIQLMAERVA